MRLVTTWTRAVQTFPIVPVVASVIVGVFFAGAARHAQAAVLFGVGEMYCHATAVGPRYFHSGISRVSVDGEHYSRWRLLDERRMDGRILDRILDDLAVEFARVVAAPDSRDVDHLLSFRCELTAAEAAADAIGAASYFRGGERVFYPAAGKIAVEWTPPDFDGLWALASSSSYVTWPRAVALVVGNGAYPSGARLRSPVKDAADVAAALKRAGFDVTEEYDADRVALNEALAAFETASDGAEVALVFYAGHGLGRDGAEYLLPVDAALDPAGPGLDEAPLRVVALDDVVAATARASARVVILDAMFDDGRSVREPPRPERRVPGPPNAANLLVAYAGSPGGLVHDGGEENSPYTAALLRHLEGPRATALATFGAVAAEVFDRTGGRQAPAVYSTLTTPVTLQRPEPRARLIK